MQCWIIDDPCEGKVDLYRFLLWSSWKTYPYCAKHAPRGAVLIDVFHD